MESLKLEYHEIVNDLILLKWSDGIDTFLKLKILRENCPCANCEGETDVFGNLYKGPEQILKKESYIITGIQPIGYYAIRPFWKDGHHSGIFSYTLLRKLSEK